MIINANNPVRVTDAPNHGVGNNVKIALGQFTVMNTIAANAVIPMLALPRGAVLLNAVIEQDTTITGGAYSVGTDADPTQFGTGKAANAPILLKQQKLEASERIILTATTAPTGTGGKLMLTVYYMVN